MQERPLYVVTYVAQPLPDSEDFAECTGAYVNVWTEATTEHGALARAAKEVEEAGWSIDSLERVNPTTRDDYNDDESGLQYFEQALIDGIVLVFHTWKEGAH